MDSPQSVVSPFKNLSVAETEKQKPALHSQNTDSISKEMEAQSKKLNVCNTKEPSVGFLDVYIHQARDIHNICIYQKQDVYAKLCLTSDPENTVSTQIINGGGRNPVFSENLRLNVQTVETSLKCEIWMLSRVRNYLEDQLLGFALVPLSDVLIKDGKLEKEFSLSSTDLFHSPAGFVQLSLTYNGASPDVMVIPRLTAANGVSQQGSETDEQETSEFDKLEFPDPNVANENQLMVTEYFGMNGSSLDSHSTETPVSSAIENQFSANSVESASLSKDDSPSSVSTNGSPAPQPASSQSSETPIEHISPLKGKNKDDFSAEHVPCEEKKSDVRDEGSDSSYGLQKDTEFKPVGLNVELPVEKVVQQDIVDMYMKSMQQFTDSLAKMKLPMDLEASTAKSENSSSSDPKDQTPKTPGSRVFYGSRAFF